MMLKKQVFILLSLFLMFSMKAISREPVDIETLVKGNTEFALKLYAKLAVGEENVFFSPYSISEALAMAYAGAKGDTEKQMRETMSFIPGERSHETFHALAQDMRRAQGKDFQLVIANALWGQKGLKILDEYLGTIKRNYGGNLNEVDYAKDAEGARKTINAWVEDKTKDRIKNLISEGLLTQDTRLVLTNAIYFKAAWEYDFSKGATKEKPFTLSNGERINVPMMYQTDSFSYVGGDGYQILSMPYQRCPLSMVVFLPEKADGITGLEKHFTDGKLDETMKKMQIRDVKLSFPKFRIENSFGLADTLKDMGMEDPFSIDVADFSGITGKRDLYITAVLHKAFVVVDEEGTEAAAATAVIMEDTMAMPPDEEPVVFNADRPFIFVIRHNPTGAILFAGRVMNPSK